MLGDRKVTPVLKLGIVPEHFSTPIYQAAAPTGIFFQNDLNVEAINCPCGTGDMLQKLSAGELDAAIIVTEGFVSAKLKGDRDVLAMGIYVESPLCWAASTGKERDFESLEELPNPPTFGISRLGSGSHVMAYCLASKQGWDSETIGFQVLGDLTGLASGVKENKADLFLWEKFTTKPLYDSGSLKYIGEIVALWPSFTIVTHRNFLRKPDSLRTLKKFMDLINAQVTSFVSQPDISCQEVSRRFNYKPEDVASWWKSVKYPSNLQQIPLEKIKACASMLAPSCNATLPVSLTSWFLEEVAKME